MKKNIIRLFAAAAATMFALSCTPDFLSPDKTQLPEAGKLTPVITVDQETNYVTFSIKETGVVPMWVFGEDKVDGKANKKYAYTGNGISLRIREEGTHTVELKAYNAHGVSLGSQMVEYTLTQTYRDPFDPAPYMQTLASQDWFWLNDEDDHFGCGGAFGTNDYSPDRYGLNWWAAKANEKAGFSLYDDVLSFTTDGMYTYDPVDGKTYVNKDSGYKPEYIQYNDKGESIDYVVPIDKFTHPYSIENNWNDAGIEEIYLVLEPGDNLSYIPNPEMLQEPRYRILDITKKKVTFIADQGSIAWRYEFGPKGAQPGLDYESSANLWKPADKEDGAEFGFHYAPGWSKIDDPEVTHSNDTYTIALPAATSEQWQAQFALTPAEAIAIDADKEYAVSVLIQTNNELPGMTVKFTDATDDNNFLTADRVKVPAGKEYLFMKKGVKLSGGKDADAIKLVFDFGGNPENTKVSVRRISLMEYTAPAASINDVAFDGGKADLTLAKGDEITLTGVEPTWWDSDFFQDGKFVGESGDYRIINKDSWLKVIPMKDGDVANWGNSKQIWIIGEGAGKPEGEQPGWSTGIDADLPFAKTGEGTYQITLFCSTKTNIKVFGQADWGKEWLTADYAAINGNGYIETTADDGNLHATSGMEAGWYVFTVKDAGDGAFELTVDKKRETSYEIDAETNLWKSATINPVIWYTSADNWDGGVHPEYEVGEGNSFSVVIPAEMGHERWKGQNKLRSGIAVSADKLYDFCATFVASEDSDITVKLTGWNASKDNDDDAYAMYYQEVYQLSAGEPSTLKLPKLSTKNSCDDFVFIVDFGLCKPKTKINITDICLQEHIEK